MRKANVKMEPKIEEVFCKVDRSDFLKNKNTNFVVLDDAIYIGYGATLSVPEAHVNALTEAYEKFKDTNKPLKILDIGSGSGIM
jgi:protein-L-isoaspartate O-methyltransferase